METISNTVMIIIDNTGIKIHAASRSIYLFDKEVEAIIKAYQDHKEQKTNLNKLKLRQ